MLYPLLEKVAGLKVHCCDFSANAVEIVKVSHNELALCHIRPSHPTTAPR